jgi:hypothetical protein
MPAKHKHVVAPKFIRRAETGEMDSIVCKLCGTVIAERMERPIGYETDRAGNRVKVVAREFVRYPLYTEIKIAMDDGSWHVTHGCSNCLHDHLPLDVLQELHEADQEESPDGFTKREKDRRPVGVTGLKKGGEGVS